MKRKLPPQKRDRPAKTVTMEDVARIAGVHKSTVSLVLRRDPTISEETSRRVMEAAAHLGYRADILRNKINTYRWRGGSQRSSEVIGYLYDDTLLSPDLLAGATAHAQELGKSIQTFRIRSFPNGAVLSRVLYHRGIRGLLLDPLLTMDIIKQVETLDWTKFTSVTTGIGRVQLPINAVSINNYDLTWRLWQIVHERGYRRIAAAFYRKDPPTHDDLIRDAACKVAMEQLGIPESDRIPPHAGDIGDTADLLRWYNQWRPDAVIALDFQTCLSLRDAGVAIPGECGFAALRVQPGQDITGFACARAEAGRVAVDLLVEELAQHRFGLPVPRKEIHLKAVWHEGASLPDRTDAR